MLSLNIDACIFYQNSVKCETNTIIIVQSSFLYNISMANIPKWRLTNIQECSIGIRTDIILFKSRNKFLKS